MPQDPRERDPKPPHPTQQQKPPGIEAAMDPKPDYGEESYKGSGRLKGKAAIITGSGSGIGRAVALAFAREGADVLVSYLSGGLRRETDGRGRRAGGAQMRVRSGDIRDKAHCKSLVDRAVSEFGKIDVLVNNLRFARVRGGFRERGRWVDLEG